MVFGNVIAADAVFKQLLFGNLSDARNFLASKHTNIITRIEQLLEETFHAVRACEGKNVEICEGVEICRSGLPRPFGARNDVRSECCDWLRMTHNQRAIERTGFDHRGFDDFGAEGREAGSNPAGLLCSASHHKAFSRQRQVLFPGKRLAQFYDATHNRNCGCSHVFTNDGLPRCFKRRHNGTLVRCRSFFNKGKRSFRVFATFYQATRNKVHVGDTHQEDERAGALRESLEIKGEIDIPLVFRL